MAHWQRLPDALDPDVRRLVEQLRLLKDRSGRSLKSLAEATACSKSAWQRYLNGSKLPPRAVVASLGRLTGADAPRLLLLWDLAEAAWMPDAASLPRLSPPTLSMLPAAAAPTPAAPAPAASAPAPLGPTPSVSTPSVSTVLVPVAAGADPLPPLVPRARGYTPRRRLVPVFAVVGAAALVLGGAGLGYPWLWSDLTATTPAGRHVAQDAALGGPVGSAPCTGSSCQGRDPDASGCDRDAVTAGAVDVDSLIVQLRYSHHCAAAWARAQGGSRAMELRSLSISADDGRVLATLPVAGAVGPADHSPMLSTADPGRDEACAVVDDVQACAGTEDPGGPPRVLTYLPPDSN